MTTKVKGSNPKQAGCFPIELEMGCFCCFVGSPESPDNFRVERMIGKHGLLLSWSLPAMDELARSNGTTVKGYKV